MGMHPDSAELLRRQALVHLLVKEVGYRLVVEPDGGDRAALLYQAEILDQKQVVLGADAKAADLRRSGITQEQQLRPSIRRQPQGRRWPGIPLSQTQGLLGNFHRHRIPLGFL